jgi:hypothetical protein
MVYAIQARSFLICAQSLCYSNERVYGIRVLLLSTAARLLSSAPLLYPWLMRAVAALIQAQRFRLHYSGIAAAIFITSMLRLSLMLPGLKEGYT